MDTIDLSQFSDEEISALIERATETLQERRMARAQDALREAERIAAEAGFTVRFKPKTGTPARPKYRLPSGETWSGRGRTPQLFREWLEADPTRSLDDLRIAPADAGAAA